MDCKKCLEIMWDKDEFSKEDVEKAQEHVKECKECAEECALIEEVKNTPIDLPFSVSDKVIERVRDMEKKAPVKKFKFAKYGAIACALLLVSVVCIRYVFPDAKEMLDGGVQNAVTESVKDDDYEFVTKDEVFDGVGSAVDTPMVEEPTAEEPMEDAKNDVVEEDLFMLLDFYKDAMEISSHTADIVILGGDVEGVLELLFDYTPEDFTTHIEMPKDVAVEVENVLEKAGYSVVFTSSSENPRKTVVYFKELIVEN